MYTKKQKIVYFHSRVNTISQTRNIHEHNNEVKVKHDYALTFLSLCLIPILIFQLQAIQPAIGKQRARRWKPTGPQLWDGVLN